MQAISPKNTLSPQMLRQEAGARPSPAPTKAADTLLSDDELEQRFKGLSVRCERTPGIEIGATGKNWDANHVRLEIQGNVVFEGIASYGPTFTSIREFFHFLIEHPAYVVCLGGDVNYLENNYFKNHSGLPCSPSSVACAKRKSFADRKIKIYPVNLRLTPSSMPGQPERTIPALNVEGLWGNDITEAETLHHMVISTEKLKDAAEDDGVIHCRFGQGRTGMLMVACGLKKMHDIGILTREGLLENLDCLIGQGRFLRKRRFVETYQQYISLYRYGMDLMGYGIW